MTQDFVGQDIRGKAVIITGASTGIGAAAAKGFAALGARLAIHYNKSRDEAEAVADAIRADGGEVHVFQADLTTEPQKAKDVVEGAAARLGAVDVLINNAGSLLTRTLFMDFDDGLYDDVMNLNLRSVIIATQAAVPHMQKRGGGSIINLGSIAGNNGGGLGSGMYSAAKAAVHNLTRHMATDLAKHNIRANAIAPGVITTPFHEKTPPERMQAMLNAIPMGRHGVAEDCVGPLVFFASQSLSGYVTGQILHVNGGQFYAG